MLRSAQIPPTQDERRWQINRSCWSTFKDVVDVFSIVYSNFSINLKILKELLLFILFFFAGTTKVTKRKAFTVYMADCLKPRAA